MGLILCLSFLSLPFLTILGALTVSLKGDICTACKREGLKIEVPEEERLGGEGRRIGVGVGRWRGGSVSGSALKNGPAKLAGVPESTDSWVTAPLRERGNWGFLPTDVGKEGE